jgi:hypothetical protein
MAFVDLFRKKYTAHVWCNNCSTYQEVQIPKGVSVNQFLESAIGKCENCGCNTLVAGYNQIEEFKPSQKPQVKFLYPKRQGESLQKAPLPEPRPSTRPKDLPLPQKKSQPLSEPDFRPKGIFKDIDFWTGKLKEDKNETD